MITPTPELFLLICKRQATTTKSWSSLADNHKSKQMPRVSYYFKNHSSDGGGVNLSERDTLMLTRSYLISEGTPTLYIWLLRLFYSENDVAAPNLLWKLGKSLIYWQLCLNVSWARKSRGKKEVNFKKGIKNIICPWFQQKNSNHMNPRNGEMSVSWVPPPWPVRCSAEVLGTRARQAGFMSWFCHRPASWACGHRVILVQWGNNNAFHAGQITEITWDNTCADPAQRRSSTNVGSHPPDSSWIITWFESQVSQAEREIHRGTASVGAP